MVNGISSMSTASLYQARQNIFNQIDTNTDGSIDKTEMSELLQTNNTEIVDDIFSKLDTNQDSLISQIEAESGMAKLEQEMKNGEGGMQAAGGQPPPPAEEVFDSADTNKDGVVSQAELAAVMGQSEEEIAGIFSQVDTDGDGLISRAEDDAWLEKMGNAAEPDSSLAVAGNAEDTGQGIFAKADANGDGSVSKDELAAVIGKDVDSLFAMIDTDKDGLISQSEDEAWLEKSGDQAGETQTSADRTAEAGSSTEDWKTTMFLALLKGFTASAGASSESTSLYA